MSSALTGLEGLASRAASETVGFGVGTALGAALNPEATQLAQESWAVNPVLVLPSDILARLIMLGRMDLGSAEGDAAQTGINGTRLAQLVDSLRTPPSTGEILELLRRNVLPDAAARQALLRVGIDERYVDHYMQLQHVLISPADLAMARQQNFVTQAEQYAQSQLQGVDNAEAELLYLMSGLPYGGAEALDLWRRGKITEERARQALKEGHLKNEFIDDFLQFRYQPLSAAVAAEALIRQRISESEAIAIADKNGIARDDFLLWSNMLGRPIAIGQALTLARRGEFTYAQFVEAVARSDVRTEYADDLWKLRRVIPPLFQISRLLAAGSIPATLGIQYIMEDGYDAQLAQALADAAHKTKTAATRNLAAQQIDSLYESGLETRDWAISQLVADGYDAQEAEWHLELLDARRLLAEIQQHLNLIHRMYVTHKIDRAQTTTELDQIQMNPDVRNQLLDGWDHERAANVTRLTNAQIGSALKHSIIDDATAISRWQENGYPLEDAQILAQLAHSGRSATSPTAP